MCGGRPRQTREGQERPTTASGTGTRRRPGRRPARSPGSDLIDGAMPVNPQSTDAAAAQNRLEQVGDRGILRLRGEASMRIVRPCPAVLVLTLVGWLWAAPGAHAVTNPTVTGPIPATAQPGDPSHDYPFFSFAPQLDALRGPHEYVEEEFFFEGTANRYTIPTGVPPGSATGAILDGGHPYKTRMIVRRPARPRDFKGTVFVEWLNVTAGYDIEAQWTVGWPHMVDEGAVYVGASVQRVGVEEIGRD